jgi:hypothetical protein
VYLKTTGALRCQTTEQSLATPLNIVVFEQKITARVSDKGEGIEDNFPC